MFPFLISQVEVYRSLVGYSIHLLSSSSHVHDGTRPPRDMGDVGQVDIQLSKGHQ